MAGEESGEGVVEGAVDRGAEAELDVPELVSDAVEKGVPGDAVWLVEARDCSIHWRRMLRA